MDITTRLTQLDEMVRDAKAMPLSSSVLVNRDEVLDLIAEMQEALPDEIKQARWIVRDREDLMAKARADADEIVEQARAEQLKMARQEDVVARAGEEADRLLGESDEQARSMRREAEEYVDGKLAQFEIALRRILEESQASVKALAKTLDQVEVGREKLRMPGTV
ncbi:MAG: cell division initiation protein, partial [Actinobacteria bacterium]|nr:cell division initiation protein [Actinomycetota bacterium]